MRGFDEQLAACVTRSEDGRLVVQDDRLRRLVRTEPDAAGAYVSARCAAASCDTPEVIVLAALVAAAYLLEFGERKLSDVVIERAEQLGLLDVLQSFGRA